MGMPKPLMIWLGILCVLIFISPSETRADSSLAVTPSQTSINAMAFQNYPFQINVTNNYAFDIYNVTFTNPYVVAPTISYLPVNSSYVVDANVYTTDSLSLSTSVSVKFDYFTNYTGTPTTYDIQITDLSFNPNSKQIRAGDSLKYINVDNITHTISSSLFNQMIDAGGNWVTAFYSTGNYVVYDLIGYYMEVNVIDATQSVLTHNDEYDTSFGLFLTSYLPASDIYFELIDSSLNLTYGSTNQGLLKLFNNGTSNAIEVILSTSGDYGSWMSYGDSNFTLIPNQNKYVLFTINPQVSSTNQTNITHSIPISISGRNIPSSTQYTNVFLDYHYFEEYANLTSEEMQLRINDLQDLLTKYLLIINQSNNGSVIYETASFPVNYTQEDVYNLWRQVSETSQSNIRTENLIRQVMNFLDNDYKTDIFNIMNSTAVLEQEAEKNRKKAETNNALWWATICILLVGSGSYVLYRRIKLKRKIVGVNQARGYFGG